jgi:hypothetical protein
MRAAALVGGVVLAAGAFIAVAIMIVFFPGRALVATGFAALWLIGVVASVIYFGWRAWRERSLVIAFIGLTPTLLLGASLLPLLHVLRQVGSLLALAGGLILAFATYYYLDHFGRVYKIVSGWSRGR